MEFQVSEYAIDCWESQYDCKIVGQIKHGDWSEQYEMDAAHLFKLEDGKYMVVIERGCSCYSYDDASVDIYNTLEEATLNYPGTE